MELIDIRVSDLADGMITVEFNGEGGEAASVTMVAHTNLERAAAILRARQVLVQLTAFGDYKDDNPPAEADVQIDDTSSVQDVSNTLPLRPFASSDL
ncbi:hypothetical protein J2Y63_006737 [Shinella sp. BE166]|uniref:hypothetical protein n=1 Tax=Shinella sp. BE166 TaxID=3373918 RepID=UPI003EC02159